MKATKRKREPPAPSQQPVTAQDIATPAPADSQLGAAQAAPVIVLASHCSVKDSAMLKESLCKAVAEDAAVTLDIRGLERIDTAAMQLLCAFVRDRVASNRNVEWLGEANALTDAARMLGVGALLGLAEGAASGASA